MIDVANHRGNDVATETYYKVILPRFSSSALIAGWTSMFLLLASFTVRLISDATCQSAEHVPDAGLPRSNISVQHGHAAPARGHII